MKIVLNQMEMEEALSMYIVAHLRVIQNKERVSVPWDDLPETITCEIAPEERL